MSLWKQVVLCVVLLSAQAPAGTFTKIPTWSAWRGKVRRIPAGGRLTGKQADGGDRAAGGRTAFPA